MRRLTDNEIADLWLLALNDPNVQRIIDELFELRQTVHLLSNVTGLLIIISIITCGWLAYLLR